RRPASRDSSIPCDDRSEKVGGPDRVEATLVRSLLNADLTLSKGGEISLCTGNAPGVAALRQCRVLCMERIRGE
ncbi:MAG: hypothetical protein P8182_15780, partial [Deltaproteobacteria bacterium]